MYEMRAEHAAAIPQAVLLWHAVPPGGGGVALCGHVLSSEAPAPARADELSLADRYCPSCMAAVGDAMGRV